MQARRVSEVCCRNCDKEVAVLSRWPIRYKLLLGVAMICPIVAILSFSSLRGVYAYRQLVRAMSHRAGNCRPPPS